MLRISENWVELLNSYNENPYGIKKDRRIDDWNKIISSATINVSRMIVPSSFR